MKLKLTRALAIGGQHYDEGAEIDFLDDGQAKSFLVQKWATRVEAPAGEAAAAAGDGRAGKGKKPAKAAAGDAA